MLRLVSLVAAASVTVLVLACSVAAQTDEHAEEKALETASKTTDEPSASQSNPFPDADERAADTPDAASPDAVKAKPAPAKRTIRRDFRARPPSGLGFSRRAKARERNERLVRSRVRTIEAVARMSQRQQPNPAYTVARQTPSGNAPLFRVRRPSVGRFASFQGVGVAGFGFGFNGFGFSGVGGLGFFGGFGDGTLPPNIDQVGFARTLIGQQGFRAAPVVTGFSDNIPNAPGGFTVRGGSTAINRTTQTPRAMGVRTAVPTGYTNVRPSYTNVRPSRANVRVRPVRVVPNRR